MHGLPIRFVVRFTALPSAGAWEAALLAQAHTSGEPLACAAGATPADALAVLLTRPARPLAERAAEPATVPSA